MSDKRHLTAVSLKCKAQYFMVLSCVSKQLCIGGVGDTGDGAGAGAATASDTDSEGSYEFSFICCHEIVMCFEVMATVRLLLSQNLLLA